MVFEGYGRHWNIHQRLKDKGAMNSKWAAMGKTKDWKIPKKSLSKARIRSLGMQYFNIESASMQLMELRECSIARGP